VVGAGGESELAQALEGVVAPVVASHGLTLVDLDLRGTGRRRLLRVAVDKAAGIGIEDCRRLSDELGDVLDAADLFPGSYDLEVSSPGLDRELRKERELNWAVGKRVRAWVREPVEGRRELAGRLAGVAEGFLTVDETTGPCQVPRALLTKVRLELEPAGAAGAGRGR
jgi:ribosome maturation factor RimP